MGELTRPKAGRPFKWKYVAKCGKKIHEGSVKEIAEIFNYGWAHIAKEVIFAENNGDGIYRPKHAPGWEIWRMNIGG